MKTAVLIATTDGNTGLMKENNLMALQRKLLVAAFSNFFILSCLGVLLRIFPFLNQLPFTYKNVLHGHSHFAFGGWVMPLLLALILRFFPEIGTAVSYRHWRNITNLLLLSAYGMLVFFPIQGYGAVSIIFSTISVAAGYYMSLVIWNSLKTQKLNAAQYFLKWGLLFLCISAIGPLATGPMIALGYQGTPLYYNAIYFYLHFQYNGWFTFAIFSFLYRIMERQGQPNNGLRVFKLLNAGCLLSFSLSTLWNSPPILFNIAGGAGALIQACAIWYLVKDLHKIKWRSQIAGNLLAAGIAALVLKTALQIASAIPAIAQLAYEQRNFVIAYLHLVLLGFISISAIGLLAEERLIKNSGRLRIGLSLFFFSLLTTQTFLVWNAFSNISAITLPYYMELMVICSLPFPLSIGYLRYSLSLKNEDQEIHARLVDKTPNPDGKTRAAPVAFQPIQ